MKWVRWKCNRCKNYKFVELVENKTFFIGYKSICNWCKECDMATETEVIEIIPD